MRDLLTFWADLLTFVFILCLAVAFVIYVSIPS